MATTTTLDSGPSSSVRLSNLLALRPRPDGALEAGRAGNGGAF